MSTKNKVYFLVCLTSILFACKPPKQKDNNFRKQNELLSIIHGGWVRKDFIHKILRTKSLYATFNENVHFNELIIDTSNTKGGDTIGNPGCLENDTEMNYFKIILKKSADTIKMIPWFVEGEIREKEFILEYKIYQNDTSLFLLAPHEDSLNQRIEYKKIFSKPPKNNYQINPLDYFLMQTLFKGAYKLHDQSNRLIQDAVYFNNDETVNFLEYNLYSVGADFGSVYPQYDYINFYKDESVESFHWVWSEKEILFYELISSDNFNQAIVPRIGPLKYRLERK